MAQLTKPHSGDVRPRFGIALTFSARMCQNPPMGTPYASTWAGGEAAPPPPIPVYTLFDSVAVGIATLLGSPIAGTILMAVNYRRLGKGSQATVAVAIGLVVTALAGWFGNLVPYVFSTTVAVGILLATSSAAKTLQGPAVAQHVSEGGKLGSRWAAAGIGVAVLAVIAGSIFAVVLGREAASYSSKVTIGTNDTVYYSGSTTEAEAKVLGEKLKTIGYLTDRGVTVFFLRDKGGAVVSFVVKEGSWNSPEMVFDFEQIGLQIAPSIGGFPIRVRMVNTTRETKKDVTVGKAIIGTKDEVYYFGSATEVEARALGQALKTAGYLENRGVSVLLSKDDGTVISFVVKDGIWDKPASVAADENLARRVASSVGGLPIKFRLISTALATKKETILQ